METFHDPVERSIASHGLAIIHVRAKLPYCYTIGLPNRRLREHPELVVFAKTSEAAHCAMSAALTRLNVERVYRRARTYRSVSRGFDAVFIDIHECNLKNFAFARMHHGGSFQAMQMIVKDHPSWLTRFPVLGSTKGVSTAQK